MLDANPDDLPTGPTLAPSTLQEAMHVVISLWSEVLHDQRQTSSGRRFLLLMPLMLQAALEDRPPVDGPFEASADDYAHWLRALLYNMLAVAHVPGVDPQVVSDVEWGLAQAGVTRASLLPNGTLDEVGQRRIEELVARLTDEFAATADVIDAPWPPSSPLSRPAPAPTRPRSARRSFRASRRRRLGR